MKTKFSGLLACLLLSSGLFSQQGEEWMDDEREWWYDDGCGCPGEWVDDPRSSGRSPTATRSLQLPWWRARSLFHRPCYRKRKRKS